MANATVRKASQRLMPLSDASCAQCGSTAQLQRHHRNYTPTDFIVLCQRCHANLHIADGSWGRGRKMIKDCVICGKPFQYRHSTNRTCSNVCFSELGRLNASKRWHSTG